MGRSAPNAWQSAAPNMALVAAVALVLASAPARAEQPRDFMLNFQPYGGWLMIDYFGTGTQVTLELSEPIYGNTNALTAGVSMVATYPLGETYAKVDLRLLFLSIGATAAYRSVWRDLAFEPGEDSYCLECDRGARRERDKLFGDTPGTDQFGWFEGRVNLYFPFNQYVVGVASGALRYEGRHDRSYDWFYTSVFDGGTLGRFEANLFVKHPDWGGIGPYIQLLALPRAGKHDSQWAYGFNATTRLGLLQRNDLLFLTFLIRPGDEYYGQHNYFAPVRALLIYRMMLDLW
jgi:hypothetical protein